MIKITLISFFSCLIIPNLALAKAGYKIETQFELKTEKSNLIANRTVVVAKENNQWSTLIEPKDGVVLLGKIVKSKGDVVQLDYLVVDTKTKGGIVSAPSISIQLGKKGDITSQSQKDKIAISLLVSPIEYEDKNSKL